MTVPHLKIATEMKQITAALFAEGQLISGQLYMLAEDLEHNTVNWNMTEPPKPHVRYVYEPILGWMPCCKTCGAGPLDEKDQEVGLCPPCELGTHKCQSCEDVGMVFPNKASLIVDGLYMCRECAQ